METIRKALSFLEPHEKKRAMGILFLMFLGAGLEAFGIGLFMPFVALVSKPEVIHSNSHLSRLHGLLGEPSDQVFIIYAGAALIALFLFKNLYLGALAYLQSRFLLNRQVGIESKLLRRYLDSPYSFFLQRNPADLIYRVSSIGSLVSSVFTPLLLMTSELFVLLLVLTVLLILQPMTTLIAVVVLGGASAFFYALVRGKLRGLGQVQHKHAVQMIKWLNQSFGGIKEIKIVEKEPFFADAYSAHSRQNGSATLKAYAFSQFPRLFLETIGVTGMISFVLYLLLTGKDAAAAVPTLALFAVAAFRLMPSVNRIVSTAISVRQNSAMVEAIYLDYMAPTSRLRAKQNANTDLRLEHDLEFQSVTFQYESGKDASLKNVSFKINRGQSVAFVGHSGAGKTTAVDIMLGLLVPDQGQVLVDSKDIFTNLTAWRTKLGYIPQSIYLSDDSIRRNVAFGLPDHGITEERVWKALRAAQLEDFVRSLPRGLDTEVGDRGARLSGGQRQRIGIARALYLDPEVLILDEATSALDNDTERSIVQAIESLKREKTIIVIAHRLSTVAKCDRLFFMKNGQLLAEGSFEALSRENSEFRKFATISEN